MINKKRGFTRTPKYIGVSSQSERGVTLIESLIYIALFAIVIGGGLLAAFQVIESTRGIETKTKVVAEANFLFRKFDWALNGSSVALPSVGSEGGVLRVLKEGNDFEFALTVGGVVTINGTELSNDSVLVSDLLFKHIDGGVDRPDSLEIGFYINGEKFGTTTRYIR